MVDISDIKASIQSKALIQDEFFKDALFLKDSRGRLLSYTEAAENISTRIWIPTLRFIRSFRN